jgi:hypothetical protein
VSLAHRLLFLTAAATLMTQTMGAQPALKDSTKRRPCDVPRPRFFSRSDTIPHCLSRVQVFGDANLKDVLGAKESPAVASGALGLSFVGNTYMASGLVNVAGSNDTVRADYGSSLLVPAAGKGLNAAVLSIRRRFNDWDDTRCSNYRADWRCNWGLRLTASASTRRWATRIQRVASAPDSSDSVERILEVSDVPILGASLGAWYTFFEGAVGTSDSVFRPVSMVLDAGLVSRFVRGDIAATKNDSIRTRLLGTTDHRFAGAEIGLTLVYDQIRSSFTYYHLSGNVDGLSRGQIVATVELRAALASGLLARY